MAAYKRRLSILAQLILLSTLRHVLAGFEGACLATEIKGSSAEAVIYWMDSTHRLKKADMIYGCKRGKTVQLVG